MKTQLIASMMGLALLTAMSGAIADQSRASGKSEDAKKEICFRTHAKLMDKPALVDRETCWRAHAYVMERDLKVVR